VKTSAFLGYCMSPKVARVPASGAAKSATKRKSTATQKKDEKPTMSATHNARWDFVARNHLGAVLLFFARRGAHLMLKVWGLHHENHQEKVRKYMNTEGNTKTMKEANKAWMKSNERATMLAGKKKLQL